MAERVRKHRRLMQVVLLLLNAMATWLMLFVMLGENQLVAWATGRYDKIRQRLTNGGVSYDTAQSDHFRIEDLPTPTQLADYTFLKTPRRDPSSIGESRSICRTINSNAAPLMISYYDDFWGKTARRVQIYVYSISVPHCEVVNVKPQWRDQCIADHDGNATRCHQYVLDNFDVLARNRSIRMGVVKDTGANGIPFLRCLGRPLSPFNFKADLLAHQTYWSGGEYHVTLQTSDCHSVPLVRTQDLEFTLFETMNSDEGCNMLVLLPPGGWVTFLVPWIHGIWSIILLLRGFKHGLFHTATVEYLPHSLRIGKNRRWLRYVLPFMDVVTKISENERSVITFKGSFFALSDVWMTHWLYLWLSILDAAVNIRATYVTLQIAESLLLLKITLGNVVFLCGALVKITWLLCLLQTFMRMFIKLGARCLRSVRLIKSTTREKIEWNVDGISILLSYRMYYVMLFLLTFTLVEVKGDPSFMVRATPFKVGGYGGIEDIAGFWGSEVACDLITLLGLIMLICQTIGVGLMYTKYKYVADNALMRLLQRRYVVSGWDGLLAAEMLGLDPADPEFLIDGRAYTKFTLGSLLQLLYHSGPSSFVHLAGDYIFHDNGFSKDPVRFKYTIPRALEMGLFNTGKGSVVSTSSPMTNMTDLASANRPHSSAGSSTGAGNGAAYRAREDLAAAQVAKRSIFDRRLRLVSEGYLGKILFIDATQPGQLTTNKETGHREYEVIDALTTMAIMDVKYLMGREKKIRVE